METIGFIGSGNMAQALIKGIISAGVYPAANIFISDVCNERISFLVKEFGVSAAKSNVELAKNVDTVVLSVKPQNIKEVLQGISSCAFENKLIISIAAGVKVANISAVIGDAAIVRVMPNTPALIGQGASALFANEKAKPFIAKAEKIFSAVGKAVLVDDENLIDAVTAVSGSGPAYYFLLIEEMIKAGIELGLPEEVCSRLVLQTAKGAAMLASESAKKGEGPAGLRKKVTSPGGTTEAALGVLADGNFGELVLSAIRRAQQRSQELSD